MSIQLFASRHYINEVQNFSFFSKTQSQIDHNNIFIYAEPNFYIEEIQIHANQSENTILLGCSKTGLFPLLAQLGLKNIQAKIIGYNEIPFFLQFPKIEVTLFNELEKPYFENLFQVLDIPVFFVEDSPGFVAARVISMIVNEAAFMVNEQIADFQSIDLGMKLGTNYPFGPSEWLEKIGIDFIFNILQNLHHRNPTGRYKIAPYLQKLYYQSKIQNTVN